MSTITTLPSAINASKSVIDTNFSNLNTDKLESTDLKTVNGNSLVGSGDIVISGGGSVATDTIWDAKGDLAGGTGANTASRLAVGSNGQVLTADSAEATGLKWTNPAGGGDALTSGTLAQFAATTSLQLKGVISDETGSGSLVFANSPTLVTPSLGVATATSINGATITSGTLNGSVTGTNTGDQTLANTSSATSHTVTLSATGGSLQLVEGSGITLTTTGTGANGIVTIASTGGGGSGDVVGPASATDNAIARFDATTGKLIQNSVVTISDTGSIVSTGTFHNFSTAQVFVDTLEVQSSDTTISRVSAGVISVEGVTVPTISSTSTLTNKRNQPRIVSAASYTTDTGTSLDVSTTDIFVITAQAGALLFNSPSGTPVQGEKLIIRIKDNGTARALTWNAVFRAMGTSLPTTTVLSKTLYLGFIYNSTDTKWDLVSSAQEA